MNGTIHFELEWVQSLNDSLEVPSELDGLSQENQNVHIAILLCLTADF